MGYASRAGRAVTNPQHPRAFGVCDRCGIWHQLYKLKYQYEWQGTQLINTRKRVCQTCLDRANPQLKARLAPPDPVPVYDPRPEYWITPGFMQRIIATETPGQVPTGEVTTEDGGPIEIEP